MNPWYGYVDKECNLDNWTIKRNDALDALVYAHSNDILGQAVTKKCDDGVLAYGFLNKGKSFSLTPKKIICSGPCTIVFWQDNTKTIVRLKSGDKDDLDAAFAQAVTKKLYGSTSAAHRIVDKAMVVTNEK